MNKKLLAIFTLLSLSICVHAQPINNVFVFSESDENGNFHRCNLNYEGLVASAKSALRYNRIEISQSNSAEIKLYISGVALPFQDGYCANSLFLQIYKGGYISIPQGKMYGTYELCSKSNTATFSTLNAQSKRNANVKEMVDLCLAEIESKLEK